MTSMSYETIFSDFLGNITDFKLASLTMNDAYEIMREYLHKGLKNTYIRELFSSIQLDNEIQIVSYELLTEVNPEQDEVFVQNIIAKAMLIEWLKPQIRSQNNIMQMFGTKEGKYFSQSAHLDSLKDLYSITKQELEKEIKDRNTYHNPYLGGV